MALEDLTGTKYLDDLNSSNPAAGDDVSEGDDHIRGIKNVLKLTFPNIDAAVNATPTELNLIDGGTARGTDALASGDGILINDGGVMKMTDVDTVQTFMQSGITTDLSGDTSPQLGGFLDANGNYMQTEKGADIASASPIVITTVGDYFDVTGTTGFAAMTVAADRQFTLQFDGVLTMTHDATALDLPSEANITTAAGDVAIFQSTAANQVQCICYTRADGTAVVAAGYTLPEATTTVRGGLELFSDTDQSVAATAVSTTASRTYGLQLNSDGQGVINVPWADTNTTYSAATSSALGLVKLEDDTEQSVAANTVSATASKTYGIQLNSSNQAVVNVPWTDTDTTYSAATSSALGLIKLEDDATQTTAASAITTTAARTYGLQLNSSNQGVMNVPWTDTNTTYSAGTALDLATTTFNVDLSELSTSTSDGDGDYFVVTDAASAQHKLTKANIALSGMNNDSGWEANAANTAITTADTAWTGSQRATLVVDNDGSFDMNLGQNFKCTPTGGLELTFTNFADGQSGYIIFVNSGGHAITRHTDTIADANFLDTVSAAGTYIISYISDGTDAFLTNSAIMA